MQTRVIGLSEPAPPPALEPSVRLTRDSIEAYLRRRAAIPAGCAVAIDELGGGISNAVFKVVAGPDRFVVKQSLARLRVADEWWFDRRRNWIERDCLRYLTAILPPGSVPSVRFSDDANYIFAMSCAPEGGVVWKEALLSGHCDTLTARRCAVLLASIHTAAARDDQARQRFADQTVLVQGRIVPYHRAAAAAHPDLAPMIEAEVERLLATRRTLVLGDYSPKNIIAYDDRVLALDFEVAHWGDPAFDVAFCLSHLVLKASRFRERSRAYLDLAGAFWSAYRAAAEREAEATEAAVVMELGCLLLARIDGMSKVEYIQDGETKDFIRSLARSIIAEGRPCVAAVLADIDSRTGGSKGYAHPD